MNYELPTTVEIGDATYNIRSDYRPILDIMTALNDPELSDAEKAFVAFRIFYPEWKDIPQKDYEEAIRKCYWFIDGGRDFQQSKKSPKLMDWDQDFPYIIAPINRIAGQELRSVPYCHWWTFLSYYYEIGECVFSQIVSIRHKRKTGKLEKWEQKWYRENKELVDIKTKYTNAEDDLIAKWTKG